MIAVILSSCGKSNYCSKEIIRLTSINLPDEAYLQNIECYDNLEYQFIFEYQILDFSVIDQFIEQNELIQYSNEKLSPIDNEQYSIIKALEEYFSPNRHYPRQKSTYYIQRENYSIVLDKNNGKFIGVVEN
ncbi:hypothetical protein GCM10009117_07130 [Gangjinia marincola]|uniref:Lipoprotein n=1 Tax=Gangjinia marincola TaxID=578463 RepID=A0ABN1MER0_9FLAO